MLFVVAIIRYYKSLTYVETRLLVTRQECAQVNVFWDFSGVSKTCRRENCYNYESKQIFESYLDMINSEKQKNAGI